MKLFYIVAIALTLIITGQVEAKAKDPIYILNGKVISKVEMDKLSPNTIASVNVLKGKNAISKYGKGAKKGVVEITSK